MHTASMRVHGTARCWTAAIGCETLPGRGRHTDTVPAMEFRRINGLPPYVFGVIDSLKMEARRAGEDVVDLGFGNPDLPSPDVAVEKLAESVQNPLNHRCSASRGIPKVGAAICGLYLRKFGDTAATET